MCIPVHLINPEARIHPDLLGDELVLGIVRCARRLGRGRGAREAQAQRRGEREAQAQRRGAREAQARRRGGAGRRREHAAPPPGGGARLRRMGQVELPEPGWMAPMYMIWTGLEQPLEVFGRRTGTVWSGG